MIPRLIGFANHQHKEPEMSSNWSKRSERSLVADHFLIYNKDTGSRETLEERTGRMATYRSPLGPDRPDRLNSRSSDRSTSILANFENSNKRSNPFKSYDAKIFIDSLTEEEKKRTKYDKLQYGSGSADVKNENWTQYSGANRTLKEKLSYVFHSPRRG